MNNINIATGEILNINSPLSAKSDALRVVSLKKKELEAIENSLKSILEDDIEVAYRDGEEELSGYWSINAGNATFDKEGFKKLASEAEQIHLAELEAEVKAIKSKYLKVGKPFLKHPKF